MATIGISLSGLVMPSAATWLIAEVGWRGAFAVYGICTFVIVIPLVARFVVDRPESMGLLPDGEAPQPAPADGDSVQETMWHTRDILRARNFWILTIAFGLVLFSLSAILVHLVPYADDLGIPRYRAAWVLSIAAGSGVLGKIVFGWLFDRFDPRIAVWISFGSQLAGLLAIMNAQGYPSLASGAVLFGFGMGGVIPLHASVTSATFGRISFGKVSGLLRPFQVPITALGAPLAGWIYDATGSYASAFRLFAVVYVAAALVAAGLRVPRTSRR